MAALTSSTVPAASGSRWAIASSQASSAATLKWGLGANVVGSGAGRAHAARSGQTRIELCGRLVVEIQGEPLHERLPGRQGRVLFAYLVANRGRPVSRDELIGALWPDKAPAAPGPALSTLLTRLRRTLGNGRIEGRHGLWLRLPPGATIDLEVMQACAERAEQRLAGGRPQEAAEAARDALAVAQRRLLPEFEEPWVEERRREIAEHRQAMLEVCARAGLMLGGHELSAAERAARTLVAGNPYRESGYALLMEIHAARGDVAEALRQYDALRVFLRDELGVLPSPALMKLSERLLGVQGYNITAFESQ
jgi:DNA-binding SARP family transcriptional activator